MALAHYAKHCRLCRATTRNRSRYGDPLGLTPPGDPRLPWPPIAAHLQATAGHPLIQARQAELLDADRKDILNWSTRGVTIHTADRIAAHLGLHPIELWGDTWLTIGFAHCPHADGPDLEAAA